jgi:hypothetical protein
MAVFVVPKLDAKGEIIGVPSHSCRERTKQELSHLTLMRRVFFALQPPGPLWC